MSRWKEAWPEFSTQLQAKLGKGYVEHTDESFARSPEELIDELLEECLDIAGWGLVLWVRTKRAKEHFSEMRNEFAALQQARDKLKSTE